MRSKCLGRGRIGIALLAISVVAGAACKRERFHPVYDSSGDYEYMGDTLVDACKARNKALLEAAWDSIRHRYASNSDLAAWKYGVTWRRVCGNTLK